MIDFQAIPVFSTVHLLHHDKFHTCEHGAERICSNLSNFQQMFAILQGTLFLHTHNVYKTDADNCLHNCVCRTITRDR